MSRYTYAFDLSMECSGLTIFDIDTFKHILTISVKTKDKETHGKRLNQIKTEMQKLVKDYPPFDISIERGFSRFNTSTQVVYRVHGVINEMFKDYEQYYYPPKKVKEAILKGDATKKQVREEIRKHYPEIEFSKVEVKDKKTKEVRVEENEDESDSFAVGITHLINKYGMEWTKSSSNKSKTTKSKKEAK